MKQATNPTAIGAFIVGALVLVVIGVLLFGSASLFKDSAPCVMYFEGDVQGLNVGAAVKFRGVQIGQVTSIAAHIDRQTLEVKIPVYVNLIDVDEQLYGRAADGESSDPMAALVARGLRAQLQAESLVTGQQFVQLDYYPDAPAVTTPLIDPASGRYVIPTVPTVLQKAQTTLRQVLEKLEKLPLEQMLTGLQGALSGADRLLNSNDLARAPAELTATLGELRKLTSDTQARLGPLLASADNAMQHIAHVARDLDPLVTSANDAVGALTTFARGDGARLTADLERTARAAEATLEQTRTTMAKVEALTQPTSAVGHQLHTTLGEIESASRAIRALADALEQQPNAVIFGKQKEAAQ